MVEHRRPPEADVPRQPRDTGRTELVAFVIRPVGAPLTVSTSMHMQPLLRRAPQAFLGGEGVEVDAGELPRCVELPAQVVTRFVSHEGSRQPPACGQTSPA